MATREQCEKALRKRLKTREDVLKFRVDWGAGPVGTEPGMKTNEYIDLAVRLWVDDAYRKNKLDLLGVKLGFPSDAEAKRLDTGWAIWRSWIAIGISVLATGIAIWAASD